MSDQFGWGVDGFGVSAEITHNDGPRGWRHIDTTQGINCVGVGDVVFASNTGWVNNEHKILFF
jgi:hypothetical protein